MSVPAKPISNSAPPTSGSGSRPEPADPNRAGIDEIMVTHHQAVVALGKAVKHQAPVMGFSDTR
jgi:hypothetical protein